MRTSGWMKRQPWFWPVKLFFKRVSGRELWLKEDVKREVLESDCWKYIPKSLGTLSVVYSFGKQRTADSIENLKKLGYRIFAISKTGRELGFVLDSGA